jgi:hypothetical protein
MIGPVATREIRSMKTMEAVLSRWHAAGVRVNPGASEIELARLEAFIGMKLPQDVREYFVLMNGMPDGATTDEGLLGFWPIERIVTEPQLNAGADEFGGFRDIAFADGYLDAWFLWLRVRGSRITIFIEHTGVELPSLEEFFARYHADPETIL